MKIRLRKGAVIQLYSTDSEHISTMPADQSVLFDIEEVGEDINNDRFRIYMYQEPYPKYDDWDVFYIRWKKGDYNERLID